ncbi:MAG: BioY family protein [Pelagibacteraceae bacterium]|nr:BioY family protein [Pelagibacteraceae bacterium]|tara:strand:+ start:82265 stop:82831 length:567 start_codon:yes stop_codon:yes gene_type:complete
MNKNRILINKIKGLETINPIILNILLVLIGTLLLSISAKVQVPFWPVPMTMQTFVVFLIGTTYSIRLSFITLLIYLFEGAIGLPVFASGGGLAYLTGPTAGYLYGMAITVVLISYLADKGFSQTYFKTALMLLIGSVIIFSFGIIYLGSIIGFDKAIQAGLLPFIPSEIFKIALAVAIIPTINNIIKK